METNDFQREQISGHSTASLVLGLIGIVACLLPLIGYPVTIVGLVQGVKGKREDGSGRATAGIVLNIVFLVATVISSIYGAVTMSSLW